MRRALLITAVLAVGACHKPGFEPPVPSDTRALEREVQDLVQSKIALVRAAPSDARAHATLGLVYEANELWVEAAQCYANAIALDDSQPMWLYHRALVLREAGYGDESLAALREAARRLDNNAAVQQRLGHVLLQLGDVTNARAAFDRALATAPGQPECLVGMASVELACEHWSAALQLAQRVLAIDPSYQSASYAAGLALQALGRDAEARNFLAAGMGAEPHWLRDPLTEEMLSYRLTTSGLTQDASIAQASGDFARAVGIYERLLSRKPEDPDLLNNVAAALIEQGRLDRAEKALEVALRRAPQSFAAHLNLAELYIKRGDLATARAHADRAVELGGSVGRTHFMRGRVMVLQNDFEGAAKELKTTVDLDARNPQYFMALAEVSVKRNRLEEARTWCRRALDLDPNLLPARMNLGVLALRMGDLEEARATLAVLEKQAPTHPRTIALKADIQKLGR